MLREIINFTKSLYEADPTIFMRNVTPTEGLHVVVRFDEDGNLSEFEHESYKKKQEITPFLNRCLQKEFNARCVSSQKRLDAPFKLNKFCSPFAVSLDKKSLTGKLTKNGLSNYFEKVLTEAVKYCDTDEEKLKAEYFFKFCGQKLISLLNEIPEFKDGRGDLQINVYAGDVSEESLQQTYMNYLKQKVFNKEEYNVAKNEVIYGVSDYLTGFNAKKPFLQHLSATFDVNYRVSQDDAIWLYRFSQMKVNRQLPNPLPIFIEKEELNHEVVAIFLENEGQISFSDIIKQVYDKYKDLGNYYLLNIYGKALKDFDFVCSFKLYFEPLLQIKSLFTEHSELANAKIEHIFDFERKIVQKIFNNQLVQKTKNGYNFRYFDDIEYKPQFITATEYRLVLKYRQAFYDFIYKNKRQAVNSKMFHDILKSIILDEIRHDEQHNKTNSIREKLNIWFSLYEFFDKPFKKGALGTMANLTEQLRQRVQLIADDAQEHVNNDNEFAFAAGQLIYYLLSQSETSNKTHALLEPFLQKSDCEQFKKAIARTLDRYKHKIHFGHQRFNKLAAEVLGYSTNQNIKNMLPVILAGYFSDNMLYGKKAEQENIQEN